MILFGFAKMRSDFNGAPFNGHNINTVTVASGNNEHGNRTCYFVLQTQGTFFPRAIARIECHRMFDLVPNHNPDPETNIRAWLLKNVDPEYLNNKINNEKEGYLTQWKNSTNKQVHVLFDDANYNYTNGVKEGVTREQLEDFYLFNELLRIDSEGCKKPLTCIGIKLDNVDNVDEG